MRPVRRIIAAQVEKKSLLLFNCVNYNLNQIAKRINSTDRIYAEDMDEILRWQEKLWKCANV